MLLERDDELAALYAFTESASSGLLLIEGPAGIGKTRLLGEARRLASDAGVRVLHARAGGRAGELEQELAFGVVRQLLESAVDESLLAGAAAAAREVFEGPASGVASEDASFSILHALYRLVVNLAESSSLLPVVDDLQWADEPSLRALCYLVRRFDGLRASVLCGTRPFERAGSRTCCASAATRPAHAGSWTWSPIPATPPRPPVTGSTPAPSSFSPRSGSRRRWTSPAAPRSASGSCTRSTRRGAPTRRLRCCTSAGRRRR